MADNNIIRHSDIAEDNVMHPLQQELIATIKILNSLDTEIIKVATDLKKSLQAADNTTVAGVQKFGKEVTLANEVQKEAVRIANERIKVEAKMAASVDFVTQKLTEERLELERNSKMNKENAKLHSDTTGAYERLAITLNKAKREYKDLFVMQKDGTIRGKELKATIDQLELSVRSADAAVHQHQRNVGNYGNSFNGLSNSINQVTREFPAFVNSAQTGFMAISNNLPILIDNINQLKIRNAELNAEGKAGIPVWKQVAQGFFSWQTLIGVGITLLVAYGKEIGEAIKTLFGFKDVTEEQTRAQDELNASYQRGIDGIKELNDYRQDEISFNTKINAIKAKIAGASVQEIQKIEKEGREKSLKELENYQHDLSAKFQLQGSAIGNFKLNSPNKELNDAEKKTLEDMVKNQLDLEKRAEAAKAAADALRASNAVANQQSILDNLESNKDALKKRLKAEEDARKAREAAWLKELELQHQVNVEQIKTYEDNNVRKIALIQENLMYEQAVNEVKIKDAKRLAAIQISIAKQAQNEINNLIAPGGNADAVTGEIDITAAREKALKSQSEANKKRQSEDDKATKQALQQTFAIIKNFIDKQQQYKINAIDREIQQSQRREDALREIAKNGSQTAQENQAFEIRRQKELEHERDRQIKKQIKQQQLLAILQAFTSGNGKNVAGIGNAISALPTFESGTEDTGETGKGIDGKGGFVSILHKKERVVDAKNNRELLDLGVTNDQLPDLVKNGLLYKMNFAPPGSSNSQATVAMVNELRGLKSEISNFKEMVASRPVTQEVFNEVEKLIEYHEKTPGRTEITKRKPRFNG